MKDIIKWIAIAALIISTLLLVIPNVIGYFIAKKLATYLYNKMFAEFDQLADSFLAKVCIPKFNLEYIKLNAALSRNNKTDIDERFAAFDNVKMNEVQKRNVYPQAFSYYILNEDKDLSKKYLNLILAEKSIPDKESYKDTYSVYIDKTSDLLDEYLEAFNEASDDEKPNMVMMIGKMYENKGNAKKAKEFVSRFLNK